MNRLLITAACAAMAFPVISTADDHRDNDGDHSYNTSGHYHYYVQRPPHYTYRNYPPYYYGHRYPYDYGHHHHDGNDDDALWAIGGLVVGAIIGNAVANGSTSQYATTSAPPAGQPQKYCDRILYDSAGNPYVERRCDR